MRRSQASLLISGASFFLLLVVLVIFGKQIKTYLDDLSKQRRLQMYMDELSSVIDSMSNLESEEETLTADINHIKELLAVDGSTFDDQRTALEKPLHETPSNRSL